MGLDLTAQEVTAIWQAAEQHCPPAVSIDRLETICTVPPALGRGSHRYLELCPGLELCLVDKTSCDVIKQVPENDHPVQFAAYLSGVFDSGDFVQITPAQGYIGGSGVQPRHYVQSRRSQPELGVNIHLTPALFHQFFALPGGDLPPELQCLVQGNNWQQRFSPKATSAVRAVVQQMLTCPFQGTIKRIYLQGKVFELMALQLDGVIAPADVPNTLKADTVARVHYAAEILRSQLEQPPTQIELAERVGVSDRTLQKGFKAIFGLTPFAYLTQQRMGQADQLLREKVHTVAEVSNLVGYANPAQFAAAFKRQFGISPSDCLRGKKIAQASVLG